MNGDGRTAVNIEETDRKLGETLETIDPKLKEVLLGWALRHPSRYLAYHRMLKGFKKAGKARKLAANEGIRVPPFMIVSITSRCNLRCAGCYASAAGITSRGNPDLDIEDWRRIFTEACEVGVYGFIIAGGEPFLFPGLLDLIAGFRDRLFIIVSNGTALKDEDVEKLKGLPNVMVVVSIEGDRELTDARRGLGVHDRAMETLRRLGGLDIPTGISVTVNRLNVGHWMREENLDRLLELGIKMGVFIEYIPSAPGAQSTCAADLTGSMCPTSKMLRELYASNEGSLVLRKEEREGFRARMLDFRARKPVYIVHSPGDEELFGGCVSAGKGFAHITPAGDMTPCPVSNIATHNLRSSPFREALASPLFSRIRESGHLLEKADTACALSAHPDEVEALAAELGAYHTDIGTRPDRSRAVARAVPVRG